MQRSKQNSFYTVCNIILTDDLLYLITRSWGYKILPINLLENRAVSLKKVNFHVMKSKWHLILGWSPWIRRGPIFPCMMVKGYHCRTWDWVQPLFCDFCKVEEHCASESPIKETCWNAGGFGCLVRACLVTRFSFLKVLLLSLLQQTSQRAMPFRISLKMGPLTIHSFSVWPMWDTWAPYCMCLCWLVHS